MLKKSPGAEPSAVKIRRNSRPGGSAPGELNLNKPKNRQSPNTRNRVTRNRSNVKEIARCGTFSRENPKKFTTKR
jgi:hypothetical protein